MALKKVVDTTKSTYLTKRFEDEEGNQYSDSTSRSLVAWYRFNDYDESTVISADNLTEGVYVIVTTGDTNNWSAVQSGNNEGGSGSDNPVPGDVFKFDNTSVQSTVDSSDLVHGTVAPLVDPVNLSNNVFRDTAGNIVTPSSPTYGTHRNTTANYAGVPRFSSHSFGKINYKFAAFNSPGHTASSPDYIKIGTNSQWNEIIGSGAASSKKMTFSALVSAEELGAEEQIVSIGNVASEIAWGILDGRITFKITTSAGDVGWKTSPGLIDLNRVYHLAVTYDASFSAYSLSNPNVPSFYINGVKQVITRNFFSRM